MVERHEVTVRLGGLAIILFGIGCFIGGVLIGWALHDAFGGIIDIKLPIPEFPMER